ncbi:helix-turn-helix domain-containing protein [Flammeovirga yaeyamensis]|uniref:Helix-turn-helix domain-containing protein n=1 Tax=Flammeovirga yaeyamensis TaxID=367791 RepID=A0AAX1NAU6_9BACT|nr:MULTISPECIES: AraC family transcriptional regulator [Flammeovirga]ANQ52374.1 AraC family transcriptional regulator [Flammeovirga sp. MY04]MBB3699937.1 AraC-like DNA-binding protein [Flammeovirga yaeyamensis]NMF37624.1 AraC family transcriptional regulator [Flammeovirga yaeyamensis]QWG04680.1 helix-turn-helix domain-containing protein [Flammeovirga yaeyamensis]
MKLVFKDSEVKDNKTICVSKKETACHDTLWHYHQQYELIYIHKSKGVRFVGDNVGSFSEGELVLVGPYLPHLWKNEDETDEVSIVVMKFERNFIGNGTFDTPAFSMVNDLLEKSRYGVSFPKELGLKLEEEIFDCLNKSTAEQSIHLLSLLLKLSTAEGKQLLSTSDMRQSNDSNSDRIDRVLKYISDNYEKDIDLQEIADIACLTSNSFCRFFKKVTNKSFKQYLNEVRIRNASRLLVQESYQISDVCYEVGFNSITNFNKQFKQIIGKTPREYRMAM